MDINNLMTTFCEEMGEYMDTPFHIYPQETYQKTEVKSWVELMTRDATQIDIFLSYWDADESEDPEDDYEVTDTYVAEVAFTEIYPWEYTVSVHVSWNGDAAKAEFKIKDGEVTYISDFESEEDRESRCCMPNDVYCSEEINEHQRGAVESLMETIRICLCHAVGEE
jgi:hypothetical protein